MYYRHPCHSYKYVYSFRWRVCACAFLLFCFPLPISGDDKKYKGGGASCAHNPWLLAIVITSLVAPNVVRTIVPISATVTQSFMHWFGIHAQQVSAKRNCTHFLSNAMSMFRSLMHFSNSFWFFRNESRSFESIFAIIALVRIVSMSFRFIHFLSFISNSQMDQLCPSRRTAARQNRYFHVSIICSGSSFIISQFGWCSHPSANILMHQFISIHHEVKIIPFISSLFLLLALLPSLSFRSISLRTYHFVVATIFACAHPHPP